MNYKNRKFVFDMFIRSRAENSIRLHHLAMPSLCTELFNYELKNIERNLEWNITRELKTDDSWHV